MYTYICIYIYIYIYIYYMYISISIYIYIYIYIGRLIRPRGQRGGKEKAKYEAWYGSQEKETDDHVCATGAFRLFIVFCDSGFNW